MSGFVLDSSVLIAILAAEPDADRFKRYIDEDVNAQISAATVHEAFCVASGERLRDGAARLERMLDLIGPVIVPFDVQQLSASRQAYARFGRGSGHPAKLNMGDCFSYALARTRNLPLLFKGNDFIHTDIEPALKPA
ncbi:type II toxin-antitoxin system VapC family toxin [Aquibium oceanicum]|uniref:Ribonuclease VapC n=1 Tax=Aquibium oceanicum TaxID=1670800 RepID=A0A1L3SM98_9HYPH|nr:type II toxin-antitoxin system VapC family toxin [Aquibium oceanicum]APH70442.1 VapC toxin family PIN domain ribonuclease [Aquibium oceanicum]